MALLVITDDLVRASVVKNRKLVEALHDLIDVAMEFLLVVAPRFPALALDFAAQDGSERFGNSFAAQTSKIARQLLGLGILDVQGHFCLLPNFPPSSL